jgi:hypothetical protein
VKAGEVGGTASSRSFGGIPQIEKTRLPPNGARVRPLSRPGVHQRDAIGQDTSAKNAPPSHLSRLEIVSLNPDDLDQIVKRIASKEARTER